VKGNASTTSEDRRESTNGSAFADLRDFVRRSRETEVCDLCGAPVADSHRHMLDAAAGKILCACRGCAVLFESKFKLIPTRIRRLRTFQLTDAQWDALRMPINLAFFLNSGRRGETIAIYPGAGGPAESMLTLDAWSEIVEQNPILRTLQPDVEALLSNRLDADAQYYIAPIDTCYALAGVIRAYWRGFSGGAEVWRQIAAFFSNLHERAEAIDA
jgi:hypothetical protein